MLIQDSCDVGIGSAHAALRTGDCHIAMMGTRRLATPSNWYFCNSALENQACERIVSRSKIQYSTMHVDAPLVGGHSMTQTSVDWIQSGSGWLPYRAVHCSHQERPGPTYWQQGKEPTRPTVGRCTACKQGTIQQCYTCGPGTVTGALPAASTSPHLCLRHDAYC